MQSITYRSTNVPYIYISKLLDAWSIKHKTIHLSHQVDSCGMITNHSPQFEKNFKTVTEHLQYKS